MFGRILKIAAVAGIGTMAYRWWQNKQAEDREYATGETRNRSNMSGRSTTSGMGSSAGMSSSGAGMSTAGGVGSASGGSTSPIGTPPDQVPAQ